MLTERASLSSSSAHSDSAELSELSIVDQSVDGSSVRRAANTDTRVCNLRLSVLFKYTTIFTNTALLSDRLLDPTTDPRPF